MFIPSFINKKVIWANFLDLIMFWKRWEWKGVKICKYIGVTSDDRQRLAEFRCENCKVKGQRFVKSAIKSFSSPYSKRQFLWNWATCKEILFYWRLLKNMYYLLFTIYLHCTVAQFGIVTAIIELYWEGICWVVDVAKPPRRISTS